MQDNESGAAVRVVDAHQAPKITRLGTLSELTLGGTIGPDDGLGGAGDDGSLNNG